VIYHDPRPLCAANCDEEILALNTRWVFEQCPTCLSPAERIPA
jgi:hypothetical protein